MVGKKQHVFARLQDNGSGNESEVRSEGQRVEERDGG